MGGQTSPPFKTKKIPLNQFTSNKKVTTITFYSESKNIFKISKRAKLGKVFEDNHAQPNMIQLNKIEPNSSTTKGLHTVPCLRAICIWILSFTFL